jgi:hypothetical protein
MMREALAVVAFYVIPATKNIPDAQPVLFSMLRIKNV